METITKPHWKPSNMKFMGVSGAPLNHQRYEKPRTSRGLSNGHESGRGGD